jgi:hypothetical protein
MSKQIIFARLRPDGSDPDPEKTLGLLNSIQADLDQLEWESDELNQACCIAGATALAMESNDGFNLPDIVQVFLKDNVIKMVDIPDEVQGHDVLHFMQHQGQKFEAEHVTCAFVDNDEIINVFVMLPTGRCYKATGRIEGVHFVRLTQETHEAGCEVTRPWRR